MNRGKYEKVILTSSEQAARNYLPKGVGLEPSPFWDFQSSPYDLYKHMVRYFFISEEIWNYAIANLDRPAVVKVLDIGSGYGEMKIFLARYVRPQGFQLQYSGCDIDPLRMERARALIPSIEIHEIEPLPGGLLDVPDEYNFFICSEVYEHLEPETASELLINMATVAQPKAVAVFTIPTPSFGKAREIPMHLNELEPEQFIQDCEDTGWEVLNWYYTRGRVSMETKNIPAVMRSTYLGPQHATKGNHALYVIRLK